MEKDIFIAESDSTNYTDFKTYVIFKAIVVIAQHPFDWHIQRKNSVDFLKVYS